MQNIRWTIDIDEEDQTKNLIQVWDGPSASSFYLVFDAHRKALKLTSNKGETSSNVTAVLLADKQAAEENAAVTFT